MSETKHTPGPWAYSLRYLPRHCVTVPRNSADVALAEVFSMDTGEREANARLIAASPNLLARGRALDAALHAYLQGNDPNKAATLSRAIDDHRAAMADAEGK